MKDIEIFWKNFLSFLQEKNQKTKEVSLVLLSLLKEIKPLAIENNIIKTETSNPGVLSFLLKKTSLINKWVFEYCQKELIIELSLAPLNKKTKTSPPLLLFQQEQDEKEFLIKKAGLNPKYSFENFAVSSTNQVAFAAAQAVAKSPGNSYNPLFLYGGVGVGKTHLAQAIARNVIENNPSKKVLFCPGDSFTNELIEAIQNRSTNQFRKKYRALSLLVVDDIQFIAGKIHVQEEFFHTFNSIISAGGQIILTSDRHPNEIKNLQDRLRSRFGGGLTIDIQPPDFELRCAILLIKAKERKIEIDLEAVKAIAEKTTDTRELEGILLSLYAKSLGKKEKIDLDLVNEEIIKRQNLIKTNKITPQRVIQAVCSYYNIRPSHLKSEKRTASLSLPRQIAMYILRKHLRLKYEEIAFYLKKKDHTTVIHAERKIEGMVLKNPNIKKEIDDIVQNL